MSTNPLLSGWGNPISYVGTSKDKSTAWTYRRSFFSERQLEDQADSYCRDDVTNAIATRTPEEMLSRGFEIWRGDDHREDLEEALGPEGLDLSQHLFEALVWERAVSGGALLIGAEDGRPLDEPLVEEAVSAVKFVPDLERRDITGNVQRDPVLRARFARGSLAVHRSRLILFKGLPCPRQESQDRQGWGVGAVENAWAEIAAFNAAWAHFRALLPDGNQSVLKIRGLQKLLSNKDGMANLQKRIAAIDMCRSILRSMVIDADGEDFTRIATNMAGYADAIEKENQRLAMATKTPMTVLFGEAPGGLNATGESDLTIYYDRIARERARDAEPAILKIARLQAIATGTPSDGLRIEWPPFWQPTEGESAEVEAKKASTAAAIIANATSALQAGAIDEAEHKKLIRGALELDD